MSEPVRSERRGNVAVVTLERPERMNALSRAAVEALGRVGRELCADPSLLACVLTGAGDKAFCAGADLKERAGMSEAEVRQMLDLYRSELAWLGEAPFVTVAAINGAALGGGLELAMTCDLRVAAEGAVLALPETGLGIIPAAGGTQRLPRLVGTSKALELVLRQSRLSAAEALAIGLVNRVSPAGAAVLDDSLAFIEPIAADCAQRGPRLAPRAGPGPRARSLRDVPGLRRSQGSARRLRREA